MTRTAEKENSLTLQLSDFLGFFFLAFSVFVKLVDYLIVFAFIKQIIIVIYFFGRDNNCTV